MSKLAQKRIDAEKNSSKFGKALYKLMNNALYHKTMEHLRNGIDEQCKGLLKMKNQATCHKKYFTS